MLRYHLLIALRTLTRNKMYAIISIVGLGVGMCACFLMGLFIYNELNYDRFPEQPEEVYRLAFESYDGHGGYATTPYPIGPVFATEFPEVESVTRAAYGPPYLVRSADQRYFEELTFVDQGIINTFSLEVIEGHVPTTLDAPNKVLLSESTARKYFGEMNPIGKVLKIGSSGSFDSQITGVFKDLPQNTHIKFNFLLTFATLEKVYGKLELWGQMPKNYTYFRLKDEATIESLNQKLPAFAQRHAGEVVDNPEVNYQLQVQALQDIHLNSHLRREFEPNGKKSSVFLLGAIAFLVLLIACINYINYSTARFNKRAKEVGLRKVMGAKRGQLIYYFLGESLLVSILASVVAIILAEVLLPSFNAISGTAFQSGDLLQNKLFWGIGLILLLISLMTGIIPALFLLKFKIPTALKGSFLNISTGKRSRQSLVVFQFAISVGLIIATIVVFEQMQLVRKSLFAASDEQVITFQINRDLHEKYDLLKEQLERYPDIFKVTASSSMPSFYKDSWPVMRDLNTKIVQTENFIVEEDFLETLGYELVTGRMISKSNPTDLQEAFVINETAVKLFEFSSPEEAVGQTLLWGSTNQKKGVVVGVVKDFHFQSLHEQIAPALLQFPSRDWMRNQFVAVRFKADAYQRVAKLIQENVSTITPNWLADLKFMDRHYAELHRKDQQQGQMFGAFALLAIIISSLGLLGLAAYAAEQRTKEIGIRKVLGASIFKIWSLLSKDFLKLVVLGVLIGTPIAWYGMHQWLQNFVYQTNISFWIFGTAGVLALLIALLTVSFHSIRAASVNPVEALKYE